MNTPLFKSGKTAQGETFKIQSAQLLKIKPNIAPNKKCFAISPELV